MMATLSRRATPSRTAHSTGVDQVVVHLASTLADAGVGEILSQPGRGAIAHRKNRVAAVGQPFGDRGDTRRCRVPMVRRGHQHQGQRHSGLVGRQRQIGHEIELSRDSMIRTCMGASR
jgi:hypothetical protein